MKLPSKCKIGGVSFTIGNEHVSDPDNYGGLNLHTNYIFVNPKMGKEQQRLSLVHELLHVLVNYSGAKSVAKLTAEQEEILVTVMEPMLLSLLRDNPQIIKFLQEGK